jgi:GTPase SAR1 family protein
VTTLNQGQEAAAEGFMNFLFSPEKELIISGPGGVGKTFLMSYLIDETMPRYFSTCNMMGIEPEFTEVKMTATTNKAAEVLAVATQRATETIHSFLNLKVTDDFTTGQSKLTKTNGWMVHEKKILFVDESSMIDKPLLDLIREGTHQSKIIFVGDHCQLAPVMEPISPIYRANLPFYELTEPMRNAEQPALMNLCNQLRHTVETGEFFPIQIVPGVIDLFDDDQMQTQLIKHFTEQTLTSRILCYTNQRVMQYNDFIRQIRQLPEEYTVGEYLVNNSAIRMKSRMLSVEEELTIQQLSDTTETITLEDGAELIIRRGTLTSRAIGDWLTNVAIPVDRNHFSELLKYYRRKKEWHKYFSLKNTIPDLRQRDAATVHKSQGSTYDTVFVDLTNISTCHNPIAAARMLYVAFTRARSRICLYGNLASKYGGLTL